MLLWWRILVKISLNAYVQRFPNHEHTPAASYYLGECYYQSGSIHDAKRVLSAVVRHFKTGRYVALSSNRLGYDAFHNKKYAQAAVHFNKVAQFSDTIVAVIKRLHVTALLEIPKPQS